MWRELIRDLDPQSTFFPGATMLQLTAHESSRNFGTSILKGGIGRTRLPGKEDGYHERYSTRSRHWGYSRGI